jgi:hypothetical protein
MASADVDKTLKEMFCIERLLTYYCFLFTWLLSNSATLIEIKFLINSTDVQLTTSYTIIVLLYIVSSK